MIDVRIEALVRDAPVDRNGFARSAPEVILACLPDTPLSLQFEPEHIDRATVVEAATNLSTQPASLRGELEARIYAFYTKEIADGACNFDSAQEQLDWESEATGDFTVPVAAQRPGDIWPLVRFRTVSINHDNRKDRVIVRIEGMAAWDGEHGIVLHFDNGHRLLDVSGHGMFL